ncbi:O-antigen ligase family protein [Thermostilla marina]
MSPRKRPRRKQTPGNAHIAYRSSASSDAWKGRLSGMRLAITTTLAVLFPLVVSEGVAEEGDGLPVALLVFSAGLVVALGVVAERRRRITASLGDILVVLLVAWQGVAAWVAVRHAAPRPAINMFWEWSAMAVFYFLVRTTFRDERSTALLFRAMIATATGLAAYGLYQYAVELPVTRRLVAEDFPAALRAAGLDVPVDSPVAVMFRNRAESVEPFATFALTNSLAAFLTPWLLVGIGLGLGAFFPTRGNQGVSPSSDGRPTPPLLSRIGIPLVLTAACLVVGLCLVLTKSRAAYAALLVGGFCLAWLYRRALRRAGWKTALGVSAAVLLLIVGGIAWKGLDLQVVTEATKSFAYRVDYWRGALAVTRDKPWFGCGPGNFQYVYPRYMPPTAGEEVSDPHNFVLEVAATAGVPAAVALLGFLAWTFIVGLRSSSPDSTPRANDSDSPGRSLPWTAIGLIAGWLLAYPLGLLTSAPPGTMVFLIGIPIACVTYFALMQLPAVSQSDTTRLASCALIALTVDLCATGGIGFPGVAATFWLLAAIIQSGGSPATAAAPADGPPIDTAEQSASPSTGLRTISVSATPLLPVITALGLLIGCYVTAYRPVLECRLQLLEAESALSRDFDTAIDRLRRAAKADPWSAEPWQRLTELYESRWYYTRDAKVLTELEASLREWLERVPERPSALLSAAETSLRVAERTQSASWRDRTFRLFDRAVAAAPTQALVRARYAQALAEFGREADARAMAESALELHRITPHENRKLPPAELDALKRLIEGKS